MNERTKQFRVGVVVFATLLMTSLLILWNSNFSALPFRGHYQVKLVVDQAPGVAPDTPVRRRGLPIGRVAAVEDTDTAAVITMNIDDGKQIKTNEMGRIQQSFIGDAVIEIAPDSRVPVAGAVPVQPGATIQGQYAANPIDMLADIQVDLKQTVQSLGQAGQEVAHLANQLNRILEENELQRLTRLVESVDAAMQRFAALTESLNEILGDPEFQAQLKAGIEQLPGVMTDARAILGALEGVATSADLNLRNLAGLTQPLGERGPQIVATMENSVRNLERLLAQVAELTASVNSSEGSIGLLIRDRQLYDQLAATLLEARGTVGDLRMLVNDSEIQRRIRQILYNVWVLTDKLARDPARLARGVVDRETPIK